MQTPDKTITLSTALGAITGLDAGSHYQFRGVPYGTAARFEYATPVHHWTDAGVPETAAFDATHWGDTCPQKRCWYAHLEQPERLFYHREFREGVPYTYSENCLNLNIWMPAPAHKAPAATIQTPSAPAHLAPAQDNSQNLHPVIVFIHGGGFDSGANYDSAIHGERFARDGFVFVSITYRVGVLGYATHPAIAESNNGRDGNFGLDDQYTALCWIRDHIADFSGNPANITVMGQSAGAISIQYLCLSNRCKSLFQRAFMMSGGGKFPDFALPRTTSKTHEYWNDVMTTAGCSTFDQFKTLDIKKIYDALESVKNRRKDNTYNTMPVIDSFLIEQPIGQAILNPLSMPYLVTYTNNDMFAYLMAKIGHQYARQTGAWLGNFDVNAPGTDSNKAFHSCDIRYWLGTLSDSHRPYTTADTELSDLLIRYLENFATTGNPNCGPHAGTVPEWQPIGPHSRKSLHIITNTKKIRMTRPNNLKMLWNMLTKGDPK